MANLTVVRTALAEQIASRAFPALRTLADAEDQVNPPVGIVVAGTSPYVSYGTTLEGATGFLGAPGSYGIASRELRLDLLILLSKSSTLDRVEAALDTWLGFESDAAAVSVPAAVESDPTLGGTVEWCIPLSADRPGPLEYNGVQLFGTRIHFSLSVH